MEKAVHVNDFINALPRIGRRKIWSVIIDGKVVQGVSATDNRETTAEAYISRKYPGKAFSLKFAYWKD